MLDLLPACDDVCDHGVDATNIDHLNALGGHVQGYLTAKRRNLVGLLLNVRIESTLIAAMRVRNAVSKAGNSSGHLADCCHVSLLMVDFYDGYAVDVTRKRPVTNVEAPGYSPG